MAASADRCLTSLALTLCSRSRSVPVQRLKPRFVRLTSCLDPAPAPTPTCPLRDSWSTQGPLNTMPSPPRHSYHCTPAAATPPALSTVTTLSSYCPTALPSANGCAALLHPTGLSQRLTASSTPCSACPWLASALSAPHRHARPDMQTMCVCAHVLFGTPWLG